MRRSARPSRRVAPGLCAPTLAASRASSRSGSSGLATAIVNSTTAFQNLDEAALVFTGKNFLRHVAIGKSLAIAKPGVYHIKMVGQHPDDNNLVLVVK